MTRKTALSAAMAATLSVAAAQAVNPADAMRLPGTSISTTHHRISSQHRAADAGVFFESFEYDDNPYMWQESTADILWLPDGWSRISASESDYELNKWYAHPFTAITLLPCYEGNYAMCILYNDEYKDEWLVSPEIPVGQDQYLTFGWYYLPVYFWVIDSKHVDFERQVFTNREIAATTKIMIQADGGEWQELFDLSDRFASAEYGELFDYDPGEMLNERISLADYAGHTVKIAFRYVGTDGNSMFIDGVSVNNGIDKLDVLYRAPLSSMYVGGTVDGDILGVGVQMQPVDVPLTWQNRSRNPEGTMYAWQPGDLPVTDYNAESMEVAFPIPAASADAPYEMYFAPELSATAPGTRTTYYYENVAVMAGGKSMVDGNNYGLLPFDVRNDDTYWHTLEPEDFGERGVPLFGYSDKSDAFWRLYTCGGVEENLSHVPYAYLTAIMNGIIPTERPLVVHGAWLYAVGKISADAHFTCSIYSLNADGELDRLVATSTIGGADVTAIDTVMNLYYYSLPFEFASPAVLDIDGTDGGMYVVMVSGMHDGGIEYFAPVMQRIPNRHENCFGFYRIEYMYQDEHIVGLSYVADHKNEYGDMYCAFAINLDAEYPWLECENPEVTIGATDCEVSLRSFYPASSLEVTMADGSPLPEGLSIAARGRFDNAVLTFSASDPTVAVPGDILVKGPGVQQRLSVKYDAGIGSAMAGEAAVTGVYDLSGRQAAASAPGVYLQRRADGTVTKLLKR